MHNIITFIKTSSQPFDCECCGMCHPEGLKIQYNDILVFEKFSDDHLSFYQSEFSILDSIINKWYSDNLTIIQNNMSEKSRHDWNSQYPGNSIASSIDSWVEHQNIYLSFLNESFETLKLNCSNLPEDDLLKVKMILLWLEDLGYDTFDIKICSEKV